MAESTPSTPVVATTETSTPAPARTEKAKIVMGTGGGFSFDTFNQSIGKEDVADEPNDVEEDVGRGELIEEKTDAPAEEEEAEETDEAEEGDESDDEEVTDEAELEEIGKGVKKGVKAFTKDGKALTLPPDLEIEQIVDGEVKKINLREHLNVVAGEMTVESRLGKISSFREQVEQRRLEIENIHGKFNEGLETLMSFAKEGKPDLAICYLAEMNGMSPIQMKKQFLKAIVAEAAKFEGKSDVEIDNYYLNLESQWRDRKAKKELEKNTAKTNANKFVEYVTSELQKENISPDEFTAANKELSSKGELKDLDRETALDRVIEHALLTKHTSMARESIQLVDPKLASNKKLLDLLLEYTHPNKFTVEDMATVVREYLGRETTRIASSLSTKVQHRKVMAKSEKQNEAGKKQKAYRSQGDLSKAFGF